MSIDTAVAEQFGRAIAESDYAAAHELLTEEARRQNTPEALKRAVEEMLVYADERIQHVEVMSEFILEGWPSKQPGDIASVYVALAGDSFSEAASVILADSEQGVRIREIEWGRP